MTALAESRAGELTLDVVGGLDEVRVEWVELAARGGNVFGTWEWADSWCRHLGGDASLSIAVARGAEGEAVALLPLCVMREHPVRLVRFIGAGPSDELGPVCAPADRGAGLVALTRHVEWLVGSSGIFVGERLAGERQVALALGGVSVRHAASPVLPVQGRTFDQFLKGRSRNFRGQVRRRMRKAARRGFEFRLSEDPATLTRDMQTLIGLHEARWSHGESAVFSGANAAFHLDFARHALEQGWLRLWMMERAGVAVAAWYGLRYENVEFYYQAGRDPAYDDLDLGFVLLCHSIQAAFDDGVREYRFGSGDEGYKDRFAECDPGLETVAIPFGARGRLALAGLQIALRTPKRVQRVAWHFGRGGETHEVHLTR